LAGTGRRREEHRGGAFSICTAARGEAGRRLPWSAAKPVNALRSEATWLLCSSSALQVDRGFHLCLCHKCIIHTAPLVSRTVRLHQGRKNSGGAQEHEDGGRRP
jgi:hypothetical protein